MNEKYIPKIAIIGLGNIGLRHLESLSKSLFKVDIYLFDLNQEQVKDVVDNKKFDNENLTTYHVKDLNLLPEELELCIVATPSFNRLSIVTSLKSNIRFLLLEKVLATTLEELILFEDYSKNFESVYVNIPYYFEDIFDIILKSIPKPKKIVFEGGFFGIACNLVHLLDISEKLFQDQIIEITQKNHNLIWKEATRKGYYDLTGEIKLKLSDDREIKVISKDNNNTKIKIIIENESLSLNYDWGTGFLKQNNSTIVKKLITYQSSRTLEILKMLLNNQKPRVADINSAIRLHILLIKILQPSWDKFIENNIKLSSSDRKMLIT